MSFIWDSVEDFFTSDMTETATYAGKSYNVVRLALSTEQQAVAAGGLQGADFRVMFRADELAANSATVEENTLVVFGGVNYNVNGVETDSTGKTITATLGAEYQ